MVALESHETYHSKERVPLSVIEITSEMARGIHTHNHPAVYPPELVEFLLKTWAQPGDWCYDPFLGSGTTIIACEKNEVNCAGIEIDPGYSAVAIERFFRETGIQPQLLE